MHRDDDELSIQTPTRSELNTFKVLANQDFTNLSKAEPRSAKQQAPSSNHAPPEEANLAWFSQSNEELFEAKEEEHQFVASSDLPEQDIATPVIQDPLSAFDEENEVKHETSAPLERQSENDTQGKDFLQKAMVESEVDVNIEKEALLLEIELMEKQGLIKLHRVLTMQNSLDEIQYQYDRANMIISTQQTVEWAKTSIKIGSSVLEAGLKRFGFSVVDGFSNNLCKDMSKFNKPLTKMYRKYWRRSTSSPEMELAMIVFGALAMTVI